MMNHGRSVQLAACAIFCAVVLSGVQRASAQPAVECKANSGVLLADATGTEVCYPIYFWPFGPWGCSWHSCPQGFTCVPTASWPYYTCVPNPPSPCSCKKNVLYCENLGLFCKGEVWSDIKDCANPQYDFCTRRQIAKPICVKKTCAVFLEAGINPCPNKCYRCVDTAFGPKCVRICKWPCTWCPKGTFCIDHATNGAMCIPWIWWQWQAAAVDTRAVDVTNVAVSCDMLGCPAGAPCVMTDSGPQCGGDCPIDNCKVSKVAPNEPTSFRGVENPACNPGCDTTVSPKLVIAPGNSCVRMTQPCPDGQVCIEPTTATEKPRCVSLTA